MSGRSPSRTPAGTLAVAGEPRVCPRRLGGKGGEVRQAGIPRDQGRPRTGGALPSRAVRLPPIWVQVPAGDPALAIPGCRSGVRARR